MNGPDRTGQVWEYSSGVFVVTGPSVDGRIWKDAPDWVDHPIVWLDDTLTAGRAGRVDGFLEYHTTTWEVLDSFKRVL